MSRRRVAVGFDLDYTLWDQDAFPMSFFAAMAPELERRLGRPAAQVEQAFQEALATRTLHHPRLFGEALATLGAADPGLEAELVGRYRQHRPPLRAYPGVPELLDCLRNRGHRLFLVSDGHGHTQRYKVEALGLAGQFQAMVFTDELGEHQHKPSPVPFLVATARLGVVPDDCVYVGDDPHRDFEGARSLGIRTIGVATGPFAGLAAAPHQEPELRIADLDQLRGVL